MLFYIFESHIFAFFIYIYAYICFLNQPSNFSLKGLLETPKRKKEKRKTAAIETGWGDGGKMWSWWMEGDKGKGLAPGQSVTLCLKHNHE